MAATRLAEAQLKKEFVLNEFQTAKQHHNRLIEDLTRYQQSGIAVENLVRYENRISWLKNQLEEIEERLAKAKEAVDSERLQVIQRSRDKKILEQLKERQNKAWQKYIDKKETALLDEIAVLSHERKQQNR